MKYFIEVKLKEFQMTLKSKEFEIAPSLYILQMLNCLLLILKFCKIIFVFYENFKFTSKIFKKLQISF